MSLDKYDKAIEYLTENPAEIVDVWEAPFAYKEGCLFQFASPTGFTFCNAGCLTMIREGGYDVWSENKSLPKITKQIHEDERLPVCGTFIKVEHLPVFAEWQRKLDKILERV